MKKKKKERKRKKYEPETFLYQNPSITINYDLKTWNKALQQTWFIA